MARHITCVNDTFMALTSDYDVTTLGAHVTMVIQHDSWESPLRAVVQCVVQI